MSTDWLGSVLDFVLPMSCALCGLGGEPAGMCAACRSSLQRVAHPCPRCALPLSAIHRCPPDWHLDRLLAPFVYGGAVAHLIGRLKYGRERWLGRLLGAMLAQEAVPGIRCDAWVPVPLHRRRLAERGFNQAREIAAALAARSPSRLCHAPRRKRDTAPQARLGSSQRQPNLQASFRWPVSAPKRIALVDDVVTTGATLNALARTARAAGAEWVEGVAVARTL